MKKRLSKIKLLDTDSQKCTLRNFLLDFEDYIQEDYLCYKAKKMEVSSVTPTSMFKIASYFALFIICGSGSFQLSLHHPES